jgi:hypothetical protein
MQPIHNYYAIEGSGRGRGLDKVRENCFTFACAAEYRPHLREQFIERKYNSAATTLGTDVHTTDRTHISPFPDIPSRNESRSFKTSRSSFGHAARNSR